MAIELRREAVFLGEGLADQNFIRKLSEERGLPQFDMIPDHHGADSFSHMLKAIRGDRHGFSKLQGVLIVADSTDHPKSVFKSIQDQIEAVGGYPVPSALSSLAPKTGDHPAVLVTLLPTDSAPGGLETLYVANILRKRPWVDECLHNYLQCGEIDAHGWSREKLDKARYNCLVGALHRDDPSRAASYAWRHPAIVDLRDEEFDDMEGRIRQFWLGIGTPPASVPIDGA